VPNELVEMKNSADMHERSDSMATECSDGVATDQQTHATDQQT
jgi:hypothetical protein